ncbi:MAG: ABC transporter ATP-binding protein [Betaproteobacteria bacterium RIFCSPLOWO2_12_FULL_64_23]|nr:MAG: ABC transporter ATP-binding protein [Betaproteobacteria bacterium RIFCSPLOWO2_12_FULL_64_23]
MLEVRDLAVSYGPVRALHEVCIKAAPGKITSVIGSNGAGKSTLLKAIAGLVPTVSGTVIWEGNQLNNMDSVEIVRAGVVMVPEGRGMLARHTVYENLELGAYTRKDKAIKSDIEKIFDRFPVLGQRQKQLSGTLSGGEQQMLAIGRALMAKPRLLMLDEPSLGLGPLIVGDVFTIIQKIALDGSAVLLVEQEVGRTLRCSDYTYVLETGSIIDEGKSGELLDRDSIRKAYLGTIG